MNRFDTATFLALAAVLLLNACATSPTVPFDVEMPPGVVDARGPLLESLLRYVEEDLAVNGR